MKKHIFLCLFFGVFLVLSCAARAQGAEKRAYTFGIGGFTTSEGAQYKKMTEDSIKALNKKIGIELEVQYFVDQDKFEAALRAGALDIFFAYNPDLYWKYIESKKYIPMAALSFLGLKNNAYCLLVGKESGIKTVKQLRGKSAVNYTPAETYYYLSRLLGERPEDYFSTLKSGPNGISMVYSLAMGDVDVAFVSVGVIELMRQTNPGPIKNTRSIICGDNIPLPPLLYSRDFPPETMNRVKTYLKEISRDPALKQYRPIIKQFKVEFIPVSPEYFKSLVALYREAIKKGWDKDYERWIKAVQPKGK